MGLGSPRHIEFAVSPRGLGYGGPTGPQEFDVRTISSEELTSAGEQLYTVLRSMDGYLAAYVGWDPEETVDLDELRGGWVESGELDRLSGLVLAREVAERWGIIDRMLEFEAGYVWLPYAGTDPAF
jgi:hypothetical protein